MARLKLQTISQEIRQAMSEYAWVEAPLVSIPTGRDPRAFTEEDLLPAAVVTIESTITKPEGIGGATTGFHGLAIYYLFQYDQDDDINLRKIAIAEEVFDFLCANKATENYKMFISEGSGGMFPQIEFSPDEEKGYLVAQSRVAVLKVILGLRQIPTFNINS